MKCQRVYKQKQQLLTCVVQLELRINIRQEEKEDHDTTAVFAPHTKFHMLFNFKISTYQKFELVLFLHGSLQLLAMTALVTAVEDCGLRPLRP